MDKSKTILYSLLVLAGGCCYGILATIVKLAYELGYSFNDVVVSQYFSGWAILGILAIGLFFYRLGRRKLSKESISKKSLLKRALIFLVTGASTCSVCVFYYLSLETTPASIAVILLFQYVWISVLLESVVYRRLPSKPSVISVIILLVGSVLASGLLSSDISFTVVGVCAGLMCALCYAVFIFLSGHVEPNMNPINRSFFIITCSLLVLLSIFGLDYFTSGTVVSELWIYGVALGLFGGCLPVLLYAVGIPKISTGAAAILGSSELPVAIITSVIVLHEAVSWLQWVGVLLIFAGIAYPHIRPKETKYGAVSR